MLAQRDDPKVIISSATLHPGTFQAFFADVAGSVPVVRIDARTHPLTVKHRPVGSGHPHKAQRPHQALLTWAAHRSHTSSNLGSRVRTDVVAVLS